jgi:hypothetical protein
MNDGTWYATRYSMLDRRKQEHSLENAFKRISSSMREMSKKRKIIEKKMKEKEKIRREKRLILLSSLYSVQNVGE